ncbi:succinylglutamate desuccinylase/aspartoacylase family protein [Nocardioides mesophilus]|uniref:Succinylglutamate desuccinylase/aspartoacylase family protein n=1 Tax=Nocardioides mesophilus TaxID=433659 RepID=A0A7G9R7Z8_9ACTN|nr:M14 family zinc carboxypeptidase [Nocardioides mesophilus]QNN51723.1 succinylglutamate desuccinylase/aspartoacylase family protein [Nocardioides mesophilus]
MNPLLPLAHRMPALPRQWPVLGLLLATGLAAPLTAYSSTAFASSGAGPVASARSGVSVGTVIERRMLGRSVQGRQIWAYRVGDPEAAVTAVAMATMHGNEPAPRKILRSIRAGDPVKSLDLWVVPTVNPDGLARGTRKNARGVDLNRNFPFRWADLDGNYESGPKAGSEPETRALMRFFADVRPKFVVSFHQPLDGVDISTPATRRFGIRLARGLDLPRKELVCGGVCHGTFTQWYNHRFDRKAVTVEYGAHPGYRRMWVVAPGSWCGPSAATTDLVGCFPWKLDGSHGLRAMGSIRTPTSRGNRGARVQRWRLTQPVGPITIRGCRAGSSHRTSHRRSRSGPATQPAV